MGYEISEAPGGRLTVVSGQAVPSAAGFNNNIYYTPYLHNHISLYDTTNSVWVDRQFSEVAIGSNNPNNLGMNDAFIYWNGSAVTITVVSWQQQATRQSALALQDGRLVLASDHSRLYVGSFMCENVAGGPYIYDDKRRRRVWNMYNRVARSLVLQDGTSTAWHYYNGSWRMANSNTNNFLDIVAGLDNAGAGFDLLAIIGLDPRTKSGAVGIGLDIVGNSGVVGVAVIGNGTAGNNNGTQGGGCATARYATHIDSGYHQVNWVERSPANTGTDGLYVDNTRHTNSAA